MAEIALPTAREPGGEPELGYGQLFQIIWRRIHWVGGALAGGVGLAAITAVVQTPLYESSMQLLVEPNVAQTFNLNAESNRKASFSEVELDYVTQLNLMRSKQFIERAVNLLEETSPDFCQPAGTRKDCIKEFRESLKLFQLDEGNTETRIFKAVFVGEDPDTTQQSLQALQQVYLRYNLQQQEQRLSDGLKLVNQQIAEVRESLRQSQQSLQQFRQRENLIAPETQSLATAEALDRLVQDQQALQADYQEAQAQYDSVQQLLALDPQSALLASRFSQSGRYQRLLDTLQTSELALSERLAIHTEADPKAQDLMAQRDLQINLLLQEYQRLWRQTVNDQNAMPPVSIPTLASQGTAVQGEVSPEGAAPTTEPAGFYQMPDVLVEGQLGSIDIGLVENMITTQITLNRLAARQASLARSEERLREQLNRFPQLIAEYDQLQPEVKTQRDSLDRLLELRQKLSNDIAQGGFKWEVVESPDLGRKTGPKPKQMLVMGAIAGLFLGGLLAYGRDVMDTVIRTTADLKKQATIPLLGVLPEFDELALSGTARARLWMRSPTHSPSVLSHIQWQPFREAVDLIYKNIQLEASSIKSVMVTSALVGEGKTTLAIGLALSAARSQKRVLLVDADLRNSSLHEHIGLSNSRGLTTLSASVKTPLPVPVSLAGTQIDILTAGPVSDDPVRLLNSHRMKALAERFEKQYDLLVFDTSAVLGRVDALQLASLCQGVVLVSRLDRVSQANLSQATTILSRVNPLGVVANGCRSPIPPDSRLSMPEPVFLSNNGTTPKKSVSQLP